MQWLTGQARAHVTFIVCGETQSLTGRGTRHATYPFPSTNLRRHCIHLPGRPIDRTTLCKQRVLTRSETFTFPVQVDRGSIRISTLNDRPDLLAKGTCCTYIVNITEARKSKLISFLTGSLFPHGCYKSS